KIAGKLVKDKRPEGIWFARLILKDESRKVMDENLYWLTHTSVDLQGFETLKQVRLQVNIDKENSTHSKINIKNDTGETSFFTRLKVIDKNSGEQVLPVFFNDNYLTLFPGEEKNIGLDLSQLNPSINLSNLQLVLEPWNGQSVNKDL
ncbi:MAG TPA: hypothetical protein P5210_17155, partial [Draconibacterium sp.]|nr:hypothetical protein [Draconibacterium sp.]